MRARSRRKFEGVDWFPSPSGDPILAESLAWMDVRLEDTIDAGDHWIALCRVVDMSVNNPVAPLIFFQGGYGTFIVPSLVARMADGIIPAVQSAAVARSELQSLASAIGCEVSLLAAVNRDELAAVATAVGADVNTSEGLGERLPMVPHIGDTYMCRAAAADQEHWLAKARGATPEQLRIFAERLAFCREHGYLLSYLPPGADAQAYSQVHHAAQLYATGRLTPLQERELRERIYSSQIDYALRPLLDEQSYDVGSIVLPLCDPTGRSTLTLRLAQLPTGAGGAAVRGWVDRAQATARTIEAKLRAFRDEEVGRCLPA